jgi:hypothetical protein
VSFDEALATADFISLHMPLTPTTDKIFNDESFGKCKKGVRIINVARGGVIDEPALVRALDAGIVAQVCECLVGNEMKSGWNILSADVTCIFVGSGLFVP